MSDNLTLSTSELISIIDRQSKSYSIVVDPRRVGSVVDYGVYQVVITSRSTGNSYNVTYLYDNQLGFDDRCDQWTCEHVLILSYVQFVNILFNDNDNRYKVVWKDRIIQWNEYSPLCRMVVEDKRENRYYAFEYRRCRNGVADNVPQFIGFNVKSYPTMDFF